MTAIDPQVPPSPLSAPRALAAGRRMRLKRAAFTFVRLATMATEAALAVAWLSEGLSAAGALAVHSAVVASLAALAWATRREAQSDLWTLTALVALAGPLGALGPLFARDEGSIVAMPIALAAAGRQTASRAEALEADLVAGRRARRDPGNRATLMQRLRAGDLEEQQFAISMVSLRYDPTLHPVLLAALQSPAPAVRVQAAAVFAKLRERFAAEAKALLDPARTPADPAHASAAAHACRDLASNPFMDAVVSSALTARAEALISADRSELAPRNLAAAQSDVLAASFVELGRGRVA